jgi:hypothetical protein
MRNRALAPSIFRVVTRVFNSTDDFLAADRRRDGGDHLELGGWWRAVEGPIYSAAWAPGTGELYLVSHETGRVKVIGEPMDRAEVVRRLDGWNAVVGRRASVEWLLAQVARLTNRSAGAGISSKGWSVSPSSLKRTFVRPALVT